MKKSRIIALSSLVLASLAVVGTGYSLFYFSNPIEAPNNIVNAQIEEANIDGDLSITNESLNVAFSNNINLKDDAGNELSVRYTYDFAGKNETVPADGVKVELKADVNKASKEAKELIDTSKGIFVTPFEITLTQSTTDAKEFTATLKDTDVLFYYQEKYNPNWDKKGYQGYQALESYIKYKLGNYDESNPFLSISVSIQK